MGIKEKKKDVLKEAVCASATVLEDEPLNIQGYTKRHRFLTITYIAMIGLQFQIIITYIP